jgi:HTH-type transcriptional regulator, competence development regulator
MSANTENSLGEVLKKSRELKGLTLRKVDEMTGISNAYLSQLENDKIKKPAADTLHKLAQTYRLDFNYLLLIAGLVEKITDENVSFGNYVFSKDNLTNEEEKELINYLQFMRDRNKK